MKTLTPAHARSDEAQAYRHLYDSAAWKKLRDWWLRNHPLCELCRKQGLVTAATVVNHIKPHKGITALFFAPGNLESTCKPHHDSTIQSQERTGHERGCDMDGNPNNQASHWHAPSREGVGG